MSFPSVTRRYSGPFHWVCFLAQTWNQPFLQIALGPFKWEMVFKECNLGAKVSNSPGLPLLLGLWGKIYIIFWMKKYIMSIQYWYFNWNFTSLTFTFVSPFVWKSWFLKYSNICYMNIFTVYTYSVYYIHILYIYIVLYKYILCIITGLASSILLIIVRLLYAVSPVLPPFFPSFRSHPEDTSCKSCQSNYSILRVANLI